MHATVRPQEGYTLVVLLPERRATLWWGPSMDGTDVVAARDGRVLVWDDPASCLAQVTDFGWTVADEDDATLDTTPVRDWLARRRSAVDPSVAVDLWNLAGDVARSVGSPWSAEGRTADACHEKLTVAAVPWLAGDRPYVPRWSVAEDRYLRRRLGAALGLLRTQLSVGP